MFYADYHTHTLCSPDSSAPLAQMAQAALGGGLSELCTTDHCDFLTFDGRLDLSFQWDAVEEQLARTRPLFAGRLPIRMGLELGEAWEAPEKAAALTAHPELDFVIGSVHNLSRADGGSDFYFVHYDSEETCHRLLGSYFSAMEALAAMDCYDVLAHIIYPLRYMNTRDGNHIGLEPWYPRIEQIFRTAIVKGKGIELNTCRGTTVEDWRGLLTLYRDCGGTIITLGSDAHTPEDVGKGIREGAALLKEFGFSPTLYEKRCPKLITL